jgi:hypothetical protein
MRGLIATRRSARRARDEGRDRRARTRSRSTRCLGTTPSTTGHPVLVGLPGSAWAATIPPALYPRGRLIISSPVVLYDGPTPSGTGCTRSSGCSSTRGPGRTSASRSSPTRCRSATRSTASQRLLLAFEQWVNPRVSGDVNAIPRHMRQNFDPRKRAPRPGTTRSSARLKIHDGPTLPVGDGVPQLPRPEAQRADRDGEPRRAAPAPADAVRRHDREVLRGAHRDRLEGRESSWRSADRRYGSPTASSSTTWRSGR